MPSLSFCFMSSGSMISWACGTLVHVCQLRENMAHLKVILTGDDLGMIERPYAIRPIITASACYLESVNGAGFEPPWDLHSNTATKSLVLRDMKATPSPRLGGLFQPKPKRHLQIREISNVSDVSDVSLKGCFYLQLAAAALSGITILDSYIQTQEMMVTTWTYQLGSSTSCVLTEFVTSSRLEHPTNPKETLNHPHGKGKLHFSLDRISGSWTVQSTVFLILDIFCGSI